MPIIIGWEEQQKAIKDINGALKDVESINHFLSSQNPSKEFTISFTGEDGKKVSTKFICENRSVIDGCILKYKEDVALEMSALVEKNHLELKPEEKQIFGL